jgi:hypothetical protein
VEFVKWLMIARAVRVWPDIKKTSGAEPHPKGKKRFHHEGHEEREVYNQRNPNPSCPS